MLASLSWLEEFVDITLKPEELAERLTEVGLGVEKIQKVDGDVVFEFEVTPNRPDWLSIVGIAREIAAIEEKRVKLPQSELAKPKATTLPMKLNPDYELFLRWSAVAIANVSVKPSPPWMQERLTKVGLRPINNVVDITNYVMFELGMPLHAFDYDQIKGQQMVVERAKGGERFTTVDELTYSLPKDAIIIRDKERIIDLAGIKGGLNSGVTDKTKNVFLHVTIDNPVLIRRASQALGVRSEASTIYERGPDRGATVAALKRAASLIIELANGEIASPVIDLKEKSFVPWTVKLSHERLVRLLGLTIEPKRVKALLERLGLSTSHIPHPTSTIYRITIPTYRADLKTQEDIIEEVARLFGYNKLPKTIPSGTIPTTHIPYPKAYQVEERVKQILRAAGFFEVYTYSLVSQSDLADVQVDPRRTLRIDNPVSREYEYLRPNLAVNLVRAIRLNKPHAQNISLFELGKIYRGRSIDECEELQMLAGISNEKNFFAVKGVLERLLKELGIDEDPTESISVTEEGVVFELNFSKLSQKVSAKRAYIPLPKYPPIIEDLALIVAQKHETKAIINAIKKASSLVANVELLDRFESTRTFHIIYQHRERNLTASDAATIREKILSVLKDKFNAHLKE